MTQSAPFPAVLEPAVSAPGAAVDAPIPVSIEGPLPIPPTLVAVQPDASGDGIALGDTAGGQLLILSGANLITTSAVVVGGSLATIVRVTNSQVFALAPAKAAGLYDIAITTEFGVATLLGKYEAWSPLQLAGAYVYDPRFGVTQAGTPATVSQWNDRAGSGVNLIQQAAPALPPDYDAKDWASFYHTSPGLSGVGTSGGGASGPLVASAKQALPTGKTYFWVAKTLDNRTTSGTQGNVANSVIGDDNAAGWSGNAGYGGQLGDVDGGELSLINWNDSVAGFQRMTWDGALNDGQPHCCMITHAQPLPSPVEGYVDGVRIASGRIAPQLAGVPIVAQVTPFHSDYNGAQLGWNALLGGKAGNDDFFNGDIAPAVIVPSVVSAADGAKLFKWGHNTFIFYFYVWQTTNAAVPFTPTDGAGLKMLGTTLYKICGWNGLANKTVFASADGGISWRQLADFPGVPGHAMPIINHTDRNGKEWIYVIGGDPAGGQTGQIWRFDGAAWELVNAHSPTENQSYYMAISAGGKLYIFGGQPDANDATTAWSRVYRSTNDGTSFVRIADGPFSGRCLGACGTLANGDGIMVCGGRLDTVLLNCVYFNGCWTLNPNTDGWTQRLADGHTIFPPRRYTTGFRLQGFFWFGNGFGGFNAPVTPADNIGDLFFTADGTNFNAYHFTPSGPRHADSWAADEANGIGYHGFGIAGDAADNQFRKFVPGI